jgi:alpha-1,2-mannosyltransferase
MTTTVKRVATQRGSNRDSWSPSTWSPRDDATWEFRLDAVARNRGRLTPVISAASGAIAVTVLALVHRFIDLGTYLMGGAHALRGDLYTASYQPTHLGFTYPPFAAMLSAPFSHLPLRFDQIAFAWLNLVCLFGVVAVSLHVTCPALERRSLVWWSLLLTTPVGFLDPVRETFLLGQVNLLLALAVIADITVVPTTRRGYLVGVAAAIKLTPLVLIPYLLLTHQRRPGQRAIGTFVAAGTVAALATPRVSWTYWTHEIWRPERAGWLPWIGNQGVVGVTDRFLGHTISLPATFVVVAAVCAAGLAIAVRAHQRSSLLGLLVIEATESMASPVSWSHHFIWIILLIAWLALAPERPAHGEWWAGATAAVFWAAPIWWVPHGPTVRFAGRGWLTLPADSFFLVVATVVMATLVRVSWSRRRPRVDA